MLQLSDLRYNDVHLIFEEEGHKYRDTLGNNNYMSVTTLLGNYHQDFNAGYWLIKKAKELHISTKELQKQWDTIKTEACARGTLTHEGIEDGIKTASMFKDAVRYMIRENGEMITVADLPNVNMHLKELDIKEFKEITNNKYEKIYKIFEYYVSQGYKIYSEIGAFLIDYLVSGCIDVLIVRDDKFVIGDWKTNRGGLKFESGYYKKDKSKRPPQETDNWIKTYNKLKAPLSDMPDCNGSIYNMQLSMYALMVEIILGIPCAGLWLCHIDSDFELNEYGRPKKFSDGLYHIKDNPVEKLTIYKMNYLKEKASLILQDRKRVVDAEKVRVQPSLFDENTI